MGDFQPAGTSLGGRSLLSITRIRTTRLHLHRESVSGEESRTLYEIGYASIIAFTAAHCRHRYT